MFCLAAGPISKDQARIGSRDATMTHCSVAIANPWQSEPVVIHETIAEAPGVTTIRLAFVHGDRAATFQSRP